MKFTPGQSVFVYYMGLWWFGEVVEPGAQEEPFDVHYLCAPRGCSKATGGPSGQIFYWMVRVAGLDHPVARGVGVFWKVADDSYYLRSQEEHTMLTLTQ